MVERTQLKFKAPKIKYFKKKKFLVNQNDLLVFKLQIGCIFSWIFIRKFALDNEKQKSNKLGYISCRQVCSGY